jgi:hypothetical protein
LATTNTHEAYEAYEAYEDELESGRPQSVAGLEPIVEEI